MHVQVWSEPCMVEAVAYEFAEAETFVAAAEQITGHAYVWGRYDILCLPPSFPYGGMENPCLTFVTPTLLAGDRSLADVVAHEVRHVSHHAQPETHDHPASACALACVSVECGGDTRTCPSTRALVYLSISVSLPTCPSVHLSIYCAG